MVGPGGQIGDLLLSGCFDGPAPGFKESAQVHLHSLGEGLSVQVHLSFVVTGKVGHPMVGSKHLLKGIPAKPLLELHGERGRCETSKVASSFYLL